MKKIISEQEYNKVIERIEQIIDAEGGTIEGKELKHLSKLVQNYEEINFPLSSFSQDDVIQYNKEIRGKT